MSSVKTKFASIESYEKGSFEIINDCIKRYVFSNLFDVASSSDPFEKIVVAKNIEYVVEVLKCLGDSRFYINSHDEFMLVMQGKVQIELFEIDKDFKNFPKQGSNFIDAKYINKKIGSITATRGHLVLLPEKYAYYIKTIENGVILLQTLFGDLSVEKWSEICAK